MSLQAVHKQSLLKTKAIHSPKTHWKPVDQPAYPMSKASVKAVCKNRSVIQYQLSSPSLPDVRA